MTQADIDRNEIIAMAKQAGLLAVIFVPNIGNPADQIMADAVTAHYHENALQFAKLVDAKATAKEREACAKVCEEFVFGSPFAAAIRARGGEAQ